jgi:glycosyltransferase involved in cell wall biosynthesis
MTEAGGFLAKGTSVFQPMKRTCLWEGCLRRLKNTNITSFAGKKEMVSIIIPTYKRNKYLSRAIESCLAQTYRDIEIIVVDDNEPDSDFARETKSIVSGFPQVKYIKNARNLGGARTRNEGLYAAAGEFVAFLDDDDEFLPTKIEEQWNRYQEAADEKCCLIYCYYNLVHEDGSQEIVKRDAEGCCLYEHLLENVAMTSTWFCPREVLLSVGGFEDVKCCQEGTLLLKLLSKGYRVHCVPNALMNMYEHRRDDRSGITYISYDYIENAKLYADKCLKAADQLEEHQRKQVYLIKYYWLFNMYYVLKDKKGKKEYLDKILSLKMLNGITLKSIYKYFFKN